MVPGHHPRLSGLPSPWLTPPHLLCECFSRVQLLPGSSVHGGSPGKNTAVGCHALLQGSCQPRDWTHTSLTPPASAGGFFATSATWEARPWSPEQVNANFPKWITNFPDHFLPRMSTIKAWESEGRGNLGMAVFRLSVTCDLLQLGFHRSEQILFQGSPGWSRGWLSLGGDMRECITRWWQRIAFRPSPSELEEQNRVHAPGNHYQLSSYITSHWTFCHVAKQARQQASTGLF